MYLVVGKLSKGKMNLSTLLLIILAGSAVAYFLGYTRSQQIAKPIGGVRNLAALPTYYASMMSPVSYTHLTLPTILLV